MEILFVFIAGSLSALIGVIIGAYAVFKTKRDPYEPFFGGAGKGESFNLDDGYNVEDASSKTILPKATKKANEGFVKQFAEGLADKVGKRCIT